MDLNVSIPLVLVNSFNAQHHQIIKLLSFYKSMEPELRLQLTPPPPSTQQTVRQYLASSSTAKAFKHKAEYGFATPSPKRIRLDYPCDESTFAIRDVLVATKSRTLTVVLPCGRKLKQSKSLVDKLDGLSEMVKALQGEVKRQEKELSEVRGRVQVLEDRYKLDQRELIPLFIASLIRDMDKEMMEVNKEWVSIAKGKQKSKSQTSPAPKKPDKDKDDDPWADHR